MSENTLNQKNEALFIQLVLTFQTAAWQQMGKLKNPMSNKLEKDLNQARFSIDILDMLRAKTQGNLTENEKMFLTKAISELQLNYVAEFDKEQKEKAQKEASEAEKESQAGKEKGKEPETKKEHKSPKREKETQKTKSKKGNEKQGKKK